MGGGVAWGYGGVCVGGGGVGEGGGSDGQVVVGAQGRVILYKVLAACELRGWWWWRWWRWWCYIYEEASDIHAGVVYRAYLLVL